MNSWDPKRLEQPDYLLRLDAFKCLNKLIEDSIEFDEKLASVLVYNCVYFLHTVFKKKKYLTKKVI